VLTTRGWALAAGNLGLLIAGRLFGIRELFELGLGLATLVIAACIVVRRGGHDTRLGRAVEPAEAYPGTLVRVEVTIRAGGRRSPALVFVEELPAALADGPPEPALPEEAPAEAAQGALPPAAANPANHPGAAAAKGASQPPTGSRTARRKVAFPVGAIEARQTHQIAYEVVPPRRGRYEIGPGLTVVTDPFGLARAPDRPLSRSFLLVFPAVELLMPLAAASPHTIEGTPRPLAPAGVGDDFFTMREYQPGDDVKKIHWRTSARQGRMMVRQEDRPSEPRAMILLDDRRRAHARRADGADSFEDCVGSAASLIHLFSSQGLAVGLALASRMGSRGDRGAAGAAGWRGDRTAPGGFGKGPDHERDMMQRLALLGASGAGDLAAGIGELLDPRTGATYLAVVTTQIDPGWDLHAAAGSRLEHGLPMLVVRHLRHTYQKLSADRAAAEEEEAVAVALGIERNGVAVVDVHAGESLKAAWEQRAGGGARSPVGPPAGPRSLGQPEGRSPGASLGAAR